MAEQKRYDEGDINLRFKIFRLGEGGNIFFFLEEEGFAFDYESRPRRFVAYVNEGKKLGVGIKKKN